MRWLEEFELKHMEFIRCIRSFNTMHTVWNAIGKKATKPGPAAFAFRQSTFYRDLHDDAKGWFIRKGERRFVQLVDGVDNVADFVRTARQFRKQELGWLTQMAGELGCVLGLLVLIWF
jgi:hypothetical protein